MDTQKWIGIIVFIAMGITAIVASLVFYCVTGSDPDHQNVGLDVVGWTMKSKGYKKKLKYLLMLLTTLYLPVFRDCVLSLSCDLKFFPIHIDDYTVDPVTGTATLNDKQCKSDMYYGMATLSVFALLVFILPLPS